jgi:regulator of sirC expression with transglutaminase-like and TPR domain
MKLLGRLALCCLAGGVCLAGTPPVSAQDADQQAEYKKCMTLAKTAPDKGFDAALAWRGRGGGDPAEHCTAVALFGLHQYAEAAQRLQDLARFSHSGPALKVKLLDQAAAAWLLAGAADRAEQVLTAALELKPDDPGLLIDRAQALAALGGYTSAAQDLSQAITLDPTRVDAFVLRATAYRKLKRLGEATSDIDQALALRPGQPDAMLERGILKLLGKDLKGARADWQAVIDAAPDSPAAKLARGNLTHLDEAEKNAEKTKP